MSSLHLRQQKQLLSLQKPHPHSSRVNRQCSRRIKSTDIFRQHQAQRSDRYCAYSRRVKYLNHLRRSRREATRTPSRFRCCHIPKKGSRNPLRKKLQRRRPDRIGITDFLLYYILHNFHSLLFTFFSFF